MKEEITLKVLFGGDAAGAYEENRLNAFIRQGGCFAFKEITFGTSAEARAYQKGIEDGNGWEGCVIIRGKTPKCLEKYKEKDSLHDGLDLKRIADEVSQTQNLLCSLRDRYLDECFRERKEISVPLWMRQAIQSDSAPNIWVDYRHEGAWCVPFALRREKGKDGRWHYYADANENEEYSNWDEVTNAEIDAADAYEFALWYQEHEIDSFLERVMALAADGGLEGEDGLDKVMKTAEGRQHLDDGFLNAEEIIEWVNGTERSTLM